MTRILVPALSLLLAGATSCEAGAPEPPASQARFVPNQAIVKLRDGSPGDLTVRRAMEGAAQDDPELATWIAELGEGLRRPLAPVQVTGGREVVVAIDLPRFAAETAGRLEDREGVAGAETLAGAEAERQETVTLRLSLAGDELAAALAEAHGSGSGRHRRLDELVEAAGRELELPLGYEVDGEGDLLVRVDMMRVTLDLVESLRELDEVEYAELNQLLEIMG